LKKIILNRIFLLTACLIVHSYSPAITYSQERGDSLETDCCSIQYSEGEDLKELALRIGAVRYTRNGFDDGMSNTADLLDQMLGKVQHTLDMYPEEMSITIVLYPDYQSLGDTFREFSQAENIPLAFYAHQTRTIYVDVSSVTSGVLAHEMAHAVINHFFSEPPPAKAQEILARYVDMHIWD
jgi:hypothetical protein